MELHLPLPVTEGAIAGVGGVGDVEVRVISAGEEVREIGFERAVGAAEALVRVVPSRGLWMDSFLCEEHLPAFVPGFELFGEALPMQFCKLESEGAEFLGRLGDRFAGGCTS